MLYTKSGFLLPLPLVPTTFVGTVHYTLRRPRSGFGCVPAGDGGTRIITVICMYKAYKKILKIAIEIVGDLGLMVG